MPPEHPRCDHEDTMAEEDKPHQEQVDLAAGTQIHRYLILGLVGKGGMGAVYKAYDPELDRRIAIKILTLVPKKNETLSVPQARLMREAQALAKLNHPNVVSVYDVGTTNRGVYIAMEYIEGQTLREWLGKHNPTQKEILNVFLSAGRGLQAAHAEGIVHRDFKPENLIIGNKGQVKILDFGLACAVEFEEFQPQHAQPTRNESHSADQLLSKPLTQVGAMLGTLAYMAPENFLRQELDEKTDQFSFCVALFEALYGKRPFLGRTTAELEKNVVLGRVQIPLGAQVPQWIQQIILRGLSADKRHRYVGLNQLLAELAHDPIEEQRQKQKERHRKLLVYGLALLAVLLPLGVWYGLRYRTLQHCKSVDTQLQGVWSASIRQTIGKAFLGTQKPFALDAWQRVCQTLDDYVGQWKMARAQVCEATWISGTQSDALFDLRMGCLDRQLVQVRELTQIFSRADEKMVINSVQAAASLTSLSRCMDEAALTSRMSLPKEKIAPEVRRLREALIGVRMLLYTGKFQQAEHRAQRVMTQARLVDYGPLMAEAMYAQGEAKERLGEYTSAQEQLQQAYWKAATCEHMELMAQASIQLIWVIGYRLSSLQEGLFWSLVAKSFLELLDWPANLEIYYHTYLGAVHGSKAEQGKKLQHCQKAVALARKSLGENHPSLANSLNCIGVVYWRKGDYANALDYYQQALAIEKKSLGKHHPYVARSLNNIGFVYLRKGDYDLARSNLQQAYDSMSEYLGQNHPRVVWPLAGLGEIARLTDKSQKAIAYFHKVADICQGGTCYPEPAGMAYVGLAKLYAASGKRQDAKHFAQKAIAVYTTSPKFDHELQELQSWFAKQQSTAAW